jgi:hypothetical protein
MLAKRVTVLEKLKDGLQPAEIRRSHSHAKNKYHHLLQIAAGNDGSRRVQGRLRLPHKGVKE